jgi:beta-lactamase superfamily II metal-dependent hydrolase
MSALLKAPKGGCAVRMYRQGLGDAFLLAFGTDDGKQKYLLIDFGVLTGTEDAGNTMKKVAENIRAATGANLDAVAVTHEHWDHVSGFSQASGVFDKIEVGEVWLAWTEDKDDPLAAELRKRREVALTAFRNVNEKFGADPSLFAGRVQGIADFIGPGFVLGAAGTPEALQAIKNRVKAPRYCLPGMKPFSFDGLDGVKFYVLGPPHDKTFLRRSSPRKGEAYLDDPSQGALGGLLMSLGLSEQGENLEKSGLRPFADYEIEPETAKTDASLGRYEEAGGEWRKIDDAGLEAAGELALMLDEHTNNTSLVLAVELSPGGKVLLFPGDAQVGNWASWKDVAWESDGKKITAQDLLRRTVLYKVGHHGSHNATLAGENGLEGMTHPALAALIPVDRETARKRRWSMPYEPLMDRLKDQTSGRIVLADEAPSEEFCKSLGGRLSADKDDLYIDFVIGPD